MMPNVAIISGEMSGDLVGGALARELLKLRPDLQLWGIGSRHMAAAGVEILYDSGQWSAIGIIETLKMLPKLRFSAFPGMIKEAAQRKPDAIVLIDFGAFNVRLANKLRPLAIPILYYFPPGSWKKKGPVHSNLVQLTDRIATPFPWSEERLRSAGANATFVGHPLLELVKPTLTRVEFAERFGMDPGHPIIGLLPGSRGFEVQYNTPAMLAGAQKIYAEMPDAQFVFGLASPEARNRVQQILSEKKLAESERSSRPVQSVENLAGKGIHALEQKLGLGKRGASLVTPEGVLVPAETLNKRSSDGGKDRSDRSSSLPPIVLTEGLTYDVMAHSDALMICSGTATLEAALLGTPMSIIYCGSKIMEFEAKLRKARPEHFGLPNIIAERRIVPELVQQEASPEALAEATLGFIRDPAKRGEVKAALLDVRNTLGEPGASERTARMTLELAGLI